MARTTSTPAPPREEAAPHIEILPGSALELLGAQTVRPQEPRRAYGKDAGRAARSLWWQSRKGLYPVAVAGGLVVVANGMHDGGASPAYALGGAAVIAAGLLAAKKVRVWLDRSLWRKNWAAGSLALAAVWTSAAVKYGVNMDNPTPTLLVLGGAALSAPWWWANRARPVSDTPPPPVVEQLPAIEAGPHPDQVNWDKKIGKSELKGTFLLDRETIVGPDGKPNGSAWIVDGEGPNISSTEMFMKLEKIKGAFDRNFSDSLIYIESSPQGRKTQSRLILLDRNPLKETLVWSEPKLDRASGVLPFAVYPDGSGWAKYIMFKPGWGPTHDLFAGGTGSGKTTAMKQVAIESMAMGNAVLLFDPHRGAEFGDSVGYFTESFLNSAEIFCGMFGVEAVLDERMGMIHEVGKKNFGPDHGHPIIHVMLDEAMGQLKDPEINRIVARIAAEGRKAWIKLSVALQVPSVDNLGDAGGTIREQLTSGNTLIYRVTQRMTSTMTYQGSLPIAPWDLPEFFDGDHGHPTVGLGYVLNGAGRALQSRSMLVEDEMFARWIRLIPQMDERSAETFRSGVNRGLQMLAAKRPGLIHLIKQDDAENVTPIRPAEKVISDDPVAQVLEYIRSAGGEVGRDDIGQAVQRNAGELSMILGDLAGSGRISKTERGYRAIS